MSKMKGHKLIQDRRELAEDIMAHAIEKVHKLGFIMQVGNGNSGPNHKVRLGALNIHFYPTTVTEDINENPALNAAADRVCREAGYKPLIGTSKF